MALRTRQYAGVTPVGGDAHHDVLLSNIAVEAFSTGEDEFIATQLMPAIPVAKQSDRYSIIDRDAFLRVPDTRRAPKTEARRVEFEVSSDAYFCNNFALAGELAMEDLANADIAFQLRANETRLVVTNMLRDQEVRIANLVTSATNVGSGVTLSGTDQWSDFVNSDPISDINTAHAFIAENTGLLANTLVLDWPTMKELRRHPNILDFFKFTSGGMITTDQLRQVFDVDRILVARGVKENTLEGTSTPSVTNIWGNVALLAHIESGISLRTRTLGLRFQWRPAGFPAPFSVQRATENGAGTRRVEVVEAQYFQDEKIIAPELGYLIDGTIA